MIKNGILLAVDSIKATELPGQGSWKEIGLICAKELPESFRANHIHVLPLQECQVTAFELLISAFGFTDASETLIFKTVIGEVLCKKEHLNHIVEKRQNARERFAAHAKYTITDPFEVWIADYSDGSKRYKFIGTFAEKNQIVVIVAKFEEQLLWNYMNMEAKKLNKFRAGTLLYQRPEKQKGP